MPLLLLNVVVVGEVRQEEVAMGLKGHNADRLAVLVHDFQSYDDRDQGNQLPPFTLSHPHGMHFVQAVLRHHDQGF